ncbi:MAG TPA: VWA domain-containing protein [Pyrinomonadaceae bacterium]|nr:VWA domain-containing protein [Pyrinomonadaceae bacterium]
MRTLRTKEYWLTLRWGLLLMVGGFVALSATVVLGQSQRVPSAPTSTPPPEQNSDAPVVIHTDLVTVIVNVTDRDGIQVSGLDKRAFTVYDDKLPQEIKFFSEADTPVSLAVIFDTSNSMKGDKIMRARDALARFVEASHREDEYFLISFSDRAQLLLDKTRDSDAMLAKFTYVQPRGETALYDATYLGVEKVTRGSRSRRAILLITDGNDTCSRYTLKDLRRSLRESDVVLYAVGILSFSRSEARTGRNTLKELAAVTGGKAFFPDGTAEMMEAFERIALDLRSQYSIGYRPTDLTGDRRWHRIKISLVSPERSRLRVRNREGFYAPE